MKLDDLKARLLAFAQGCRSSMWQSRDETIRLMEEAATAITDLEAQVKRLSGDGIHTCYDQCPRVACVLRREKADLEALVGELGVFARHDPACKSLWPDYPPPDFEITFPLPCDCGLSATLAKLEKARGKDQTDG